MHKHPLHSVLSSPSEPVMEQATAFAPSNIALVKYWGKRNSDYNLPLTDSLSVSLDNKGTTTTISIADGQDQCILNGKPIEMHSDFGKRLTHFLDGVRPGGLCFHIETTSNIPVAAGLASSASGFAALVLALNQLFGWQCSDTDLSRMARVGSGSACRSIWNGFVKWQAGTEATGQDSFGIPLDITWPELRIGLLIVDEAEKPMSSRRAMNHTVATSDLFRTWPERTAQAMRQLESALSEKDFGTLGHIAENHALLMHATMEDAKPPVSYSTEATQAIRKKVWKLRQDGIAVFSTQDAGPNIKLLFLQPTQSVVLETFPDMEIVEPFKTHLPSA